MTRGGVVKSLGSGLVCLVFFSHFLSTWKSVWRFLVGLDAQMQNRMLCKMSFTTECMDLQTLLFNLNMIKYGTKTIHFPFNLIKKGILSHSCLILAEFPNSLRSMLSCFEHHSASRICNWGQIWTVRRPVKHLHFWDLDSWYQRIFFH